ncbi:Ig-like domain-containing protein [Bradyrhizobium sp. AUGA SZCCT0431]|uniref:Ig-like domain-containing protein n=1 Tax=Bradyrhizobium sp. AUGA SZCCT0431 TaxID=2807674 RepID=UPI001BAE0066|nr:Ig-like domain-containing protein [Bradyrhizobium sp. AUGA SZCCT0431]MBR1142606.1 hypothetical protein [Bradyrhizobium sp. AUGA SZCCT0431]
MAISLSDIVAQNTVGQSEGRPVGVPTSWGWYSGLYRPAGYSAAPANFTAVTGWGQVYQKAGAPAYSNPNATVEVANSRTYVHLKTTGEWVLVQNQATNPIAGAHFVNDFSGQARGMEISRLPNGNAMLDTPPGGYNDHFWLGARGVYGAGTVDAVYVQMDMRVSDPNLHLIANVGADWWVGPNAPFLSDMSNNPGAGMSNWVELSTDWSTLGFYSTTTAQFLGDLPTPLVGSTPEPETKPTITLFSSDSGTVGDRITNDDTLTFTGTAKASGKINVYDGATLIGTTTANASGAWSFTTAKLSNATHNFTAKATDNTSLTSATLSVTVDAVAPAMPKITAFVPDTGIAGDGITNANRLTLTGTAEAGSVVRIFDGTTEIGAATANTSGAWRFATVQLSNSTHNFTARARDAAGNTGSASLGLTVTVDASWSPQPDTGENLLVNGSFEMSAVAGGRWAAFSSISGWTAVTGGTIELWNNLNTVKATDGVNFGELDYLGARDGFYQTVSTVAGQNYELSFDARARPGFTSTTTTIEVLWNDSVIAIVPPGSSWKTYQFAVTGTGGQDRLTFREAAGQGADGLGALYDNVSLVATSTASIAPSMMQATDQAMGLVTQYSAASFVDSGPGLGAVLSAADTLSMPPLLAKAQ